MSKRPRDVQEVKGCPGGQGMSRRSRDGSQNVSLHLHCLTLIDNMGSDGNGLIIIINTLITCTDYKEWDKMAREFALARALPNS